MTRKTIIQTLNENAIADKYLYKLLRKIQLMNMNRRCLALKP
ncbi:MULTISPECIES: hypothetical protein [Enterococcaceae]|nr:hypothetical protein [Vagococcus lutrae]